MGGGAVTTYPEHEKMAAVKDRSQAIGEFIEWLNGQGIVMAQYQPVEGYSNHVLLPTAERIETVLARYFAIDLRAIEAEKQAMIEAMREMNR